MSYVKRSIFLSTKTKRGLWADPHAVPPWEWRRMRKRYR